MFGQLIGSQLERHTSRLGCTERCQLLPEFRVKPQLGTSSRADCVPIRLTRPMVGCPGAVCCVPVLCSGAQLRTAPGLDLALLCLEEEEKASPLS